MGQVHKTSAVRVRGVQNAPDFVDGDTLSENADEGRGEGKNPEKFGNVVCTCSLL